MGARAGGERRGVNGEVSVSGRPDLAFPVLRGVGSRRVPAPATDGVQTFDIELLGLATSVSVDVEATTTWQDVDGTIAADADWGDGARVRVTGDLQVDAGVTLRIGPDSVVEVGPEVEISIDGTLRIEGTKANPVVFTPRDHSVPWGGLLLRAATATLEADGTIFTGSGANDDWFDEVSGSGSSHRDEQALIYLSDGATATLNDCYLIDNHGQAGHGEDSFLELNRCLVQRCVTVGQYNDGAVIVRDSALIEFPAHDVPFEDDDNDGLYLTGGAHELHNSLVGWALDDGVDAGSGSGGSVLVDGCWFESCYHEAMAWSEDRDATVRNTVAINSGQGIECGFGDPIVDAANVLCTGNLVGARFGDNYDWDYDGFLTVADSLLLYNRRDLWGQAWDDWSVHDGQMDVAGNILTIENPNFASNTLWDPAADASRLDPFLPTPATRVGIGIGVGEDFLGQQLSSDGVPVRLSTFTPETVSVEFTVTGGPAPREGVLTFPPGQTVQRIALTAAEGEATFVTVSIANPSGADLTGDAEVSFVRDETIIARGSEWKYFDLGRSPGADWQEPTFNDSTWAAGPAELGYGDDDEATEVEGGPSDARFPTTYFRHTFEIAPGRFYRRAALGLRRDDGAVVYLDGVEVFRSNMPDGEVTYETYADSSGTSESRFYEAELNPAQLLPGTHTFAVEVHQANATSSDISFDFELVATPLAPGTATFVRGDVNFDRRLDLGDAVRGLFVLFAEEPTDCADTLDSNDDGALDLTDVLHVLNFLFVGGNPPAAPFPSPGEDPTEDGLAECSRVTL